MKSLTDVFRALQTLQSEGVVTRYAVGGTIAALFSAEATRCFEMLVCTSGLSQTEEQILSDWARQYNFAVRDGLIVVEGVPIRFIEQRDALEREAVCQAELKQYRDVSVCVMRAEHLVALYLRDRHSGWGYLPSYFAPETIDTAVLEAISERADLLPRWRLWQEDEDGTALDSERFRSKRRWHEENACIPVAEKVRQVLRLQEFDLPLTAARRPLKWWEKPWDIES